MIGNEMSKLVSDYVAKDQDATVLVSAQVPLFIYCYIYRNCVNMCIRWNLSYLH